MPHSSRGVLVCLNTNHPLATRMGGVATSRTPLECSSIEPRHWGMPDRSFRKLVMKALFAAAAALVLAASASANTVTVSNTTHKDPTGFGTAFTDSDVYTFTLTSDTWFSGQLNTAGKLSSVPAVDINAVTLSNLTTGESISWSQVLGVDWSAKRVGLEQWALSPLQLDAGTWSLSISGVSYSNKQGNGYNVAVALPEPGSVALAFAAVAGALVASRRRKSA